MCVKVVVVRALTVVSGQAEIIACKDEISFVLKSFVASVSAVKTPYDISSALLTDGKWLQFDIK